MSRHLEFTPEKLEEFRKLYYKALEEETETFEFQGYPIFVLYARYMIEYLEDKMKDHG